MRLFAHVTRKFGRRRNEGCHSEFARNIRARLISLCLILVGATVASGCVASREYLQDSQRFTLPWHPDVKRIRFFNRCELHIPTRFYSPSRDLREDKTSPARIDCPRIFDIAKASRELAVLLAERRITMDELDVLESRQDFVQRYSRSIDRGRLETFYDLVAQSVEEGKPFETDLLFTGPSFAREVAGLSPTQVFAGSPRESFYVFWSSSGCPGNYRLLWNTVALLTLTLWPTSGSECFVKFYLHVNYYQNGFRPIGTRTIEYRNGGYGSLFVVPAWIAYALKDDGTGSLDSDPKLLTRLVGNLVLAIAEGAPSEGNGKDP